MLCRPCTQSVSPFHACVWLWLNEYCASTSDSTPLEKVSLGGPQFTGSWLLPPIIALPDTFVRFAKNGVTSVVRRLS